MIGRIIKWIVFKCIYPFWYFICSLKKTDDKKVIFVENHQASLSDNFVLLYEALDKNGYKLSTHYLMVADSGWKDIIGRTLAMLKDMAAARCVFINESNSVFGVIPLRKETALVQVWHACGAFKKWGFSVAEKSFGDDKRALKKYSGHRSYSLVPVSGKAVCWAYEEAFGLERKNGIVKPLGVSRTDIYFDDEYRNQAEYKLRGLGIPIRDRRVILYAPTFRGDIKDAVSPECMDYKSFCEDLGKDYVLLVKQHPFVKKPIAISDDIKDTVVEITDEMTTEELLITADICITDYSSVIFEYSLMNKPMVFFASDLDEYYDERGFYYPYREFVPGPIVTDTKELIECIHGIDRYDYDRLKAFREKYMSGCDGHSTKRIIAEVFKEGEI